MTAAKPAMKLPCGFCANGMHEKCPRLFASPHPEPYACPCKVGTHRNPCCRDCGSDVDTLGGDVRCLDRIGCEGRCAVRQAGNELHHLIQECVSTSRAVTPEGEPVPRKRREPAVAKAPRACACGCEGQTRGGSFLPGHDARLVSTIAASVLGGELSRADGEALLRDYPALLGKLGKRVSP